MLLKPSQWVLGCQAWSRTLFVSFCILLMEAALGPRLHMTPLVCTPPVYSHACLAPHTHHSQIELFIPHKPTPSWLSPARQMGTTMHIGCLGQHSGLLAPCSSLRFFHGPHPDLSASMQIGFLKCKLLGAPSPQPRLEPRWILNCFSGGSC